MNEAVVQHTVINGTAEYIAALDALCASAQRTLLIFENDFENIGFNTETRFNTLRSFLLASPNARLHLLAHDTQVLARFCPRMMLLLRQFSHNMSIRQTPAHLRHITEPFAVADETGFVRCFHFDDARGVWAQNDHREARLFKSRFEEMWATSRPGASATTLGL